MRRKRPVTYAAIVAKAQAWRRIDALVSAVHESRNRFQCEFERGVRDKRMDDRSVADRFAARLYGDAAFTGVEKSPCWRSLETFYDGSPVRPQHWCGPCLTRTKLHLALKAVRAIHGARLRSLRHAAAAPTKECA